MTAKIFRNAFLIGFTVLLACILLFFFIMYSNYQAQAYDILEVEGVSRCNAVRRAHHMDRAGRFRSL